MVVGKTMPTEHFHSIKRADYGYSYCRPKKRNKIIMLEHILHFLKQNLEP